MLKIDLNKVNRRYNEAEEARKKAWRAYRRKVQALTEAVAHLIPGIEKRGFNDHHIDHKVSIWYGFNHGIPEEQIADISNLRMLKNTENMRKGRRNELSNFQ